MRDILGEVKGKMSPEDLASYTEKAEESKKIFETTSSPMVAGSLGGEISLALLGAEQVGLVKLEDLPKILRAAALAMEGIILADKYLPKPEIPPVQPVDISTVN